MQTHLGQLAPLAVAATLWLGIGTGPAAAQTADPETVVARVNGEEITLGHMIVAHASLPQQYQQLAPQVLFDGILDQLIQQTALKQSQGTTLPRHIELSLDNERRTLMAAEAIDALLERPVPDSDIRAAYHAEFSDGYGEEEFRASHILLESREEASAVKDTLDQGADFAALAKEQSIGPSGPSGGDLGWFARGVMVPAFETAVLGLQPGEVSEPIQTQFGWHVIKLHDTRQSEAPSFEQVSAQLEQELREARVTEHLETLTAQAEVVRPDISRIDPTVLRDFDLVRD